jgi:nucleoside-triphosphatase
MNLRAIVLMTGFSVIGSELRNPLIGAWLAKRGAGEFFATLEICFEALPSMIASLPPAKEILKTPLASVCGMLGRADFWLEDFRKKSGHVSPAVRVESFYLSVPESAGVRVFIITGARGSGKSGLLAAAASALKGAGVTVGGIRAPGLWQNGERCGFDIVDLLTGERTELCRRDGHAAWPKAGPFRFRPEGLQFGRKALAIPYLTNAALAVIDEIGPWELDGGGWAPELELLLKEEKKVVLLVVRKDLLEKVCARWKLSPSVWEPVPGGDSAITSELCAALRGAVSSLKPPAA